MYLHVDVYYKEHGVRVAEQLKMNVKKLRNILEVSGWRQSLVPSFFSRNKTFVIVAKNYAKADTKVFFSCPTLLDFFTLFHIFCLPM